MHPRTCVAGPPGAEAALSLDCLELFDLGLRAQDSQIASPCGRSYMEQTAANLGFSVDARPDTTVKRQLSQKDGKAQRRREQGQAEREAKLARLIFRDESLVDKLDELVPKSKRRSRAPATRDDADDVREDGEEDSEDEEGSEEEGEESEDEAPKAAWVDEDDATLSVDVMQQKRLRKLRKTKREAVLQGADYEERLREQVCR